MIYSIEVVTKYKKISLYDILKLNQPIIKLSCITFVNLNILPDCITLSSLLNSPIRFIPDGILSASF